MEIPPLTRDDHPRTRPRPRAGGDREDRSRDDDTGIVWGRRPVLEVLRSGGGVERILVARELAPSGIIGDIRRRAEAAAVPVRLVPKSEVAAAAGAVNHQGVVAFTARFRYAPLDDILSGSTSRRAGPSRRDDACVLFLDGVTDPHNLGSLLRSADGAGFHGVVIPARRSAGVTAAVRRVSAGAAEVVPVARVNSLGSALEQAKKAGLWIVGLDGDAEEDLWTSSLAEPPVGLVLGAEDRGISRGTSARCDAVLRIPSAGRISSLNVAVAGAIAMFEVSRRVRSLPATGGPTDAT